jgi:16S rRNA (guanine966-N2)-methyltransferase
MRVISGIHKGARLQAVPGDMTRPMLDRVKTALFDTLRPNISGVKILDAFAGTGQLGIEALSQGAASCVFLDTSKEAVATIRQNLTSTGIVEQAEVRHTDAFTFLRNTAKSFDLIFLDPPQFKNLWIESLQTIAERPQLLTSGGTILIKIDPSEYEQLSLTAFNEQKQRRYGNSLLLFFGHTTAS